ncbi:hypothetical protein WN51_01549 [Melipona quadrifasciata]|uniref:Uncharacterized protein n=1 Tax=Melipona quadrifasciata TaxID=166423 RepID=A0A0M8ZYZ8_9HYME|nr:hypothetical protein WN51_01549 [Melipona quadrifasciata]
MEIEEPTKENAVEVIRESVRELVHTERKENRTRTSNKNRVALGNIATKTPFTTEFVVEKAKALKKKALSIEEYEKLQNALIQSEHNVNSFLKVDNILFSLVRDLSSTNFALQLCAASCCCNIALGNAKACISLTKSIGPYLVLELDTLNYPLLEICIWTMGNLISGNNKAFEILHAQDCLKYIVSLIHNCNDTILPSVAYTAMHYVHTGFKCIEENEMTELANAATRRNLSFENPYFIWLLALLSSQKCCNTCLYNVVPLIVDYLYQNTTNNFICITACVRILANVLVQERSGQLMKYLLENQKYAPSDLETLINKLLSCQYIHIRKETLWLIGNLCNHESPDVKIAVQGIIPRLSFLKQAILSTTRQYQYQIHDESNLNIP